MQALAGVLTVFVVFIAFILFIMLLRAFRVLNEYERAVIFRLGKYSGLKGPGLIILIPILDRMVKVSLRTIAFDVPSQDIITKDNVSVKVNAVIYYRVVEPDKAIIQIEDFNYASSLVSQTTLRSVLGQSDLDELLSHRDMINSKLTQIIDRETEPWGIKIMNVELKNVDLPQEMIRAMGRQAEAERDKRAKIINSEGEFLSATKLSEAAGILGSNPNSMQLRYLQVMTEIATEKTSTLIIPLPMEMLKYFDIMNKKAESETKP
ncbi:MAG: slipin family protein [Ignavibacteriae bacterium]|jgi:regulator of protease activity HflC (stomatin/prohibitin superfamily)|nr:slipin family protein [Ignavibacteriota bacterium]